MRSQVCVPMALPHPVRFGHWLAMTEGPPPPSSRLVESERLAAAPLPAVGGQFLAKSSVLWQFHLGTWNFSQCLLSLLVADKWKRSNLELKSSKILWFLTTSSLGSETTLLSLLSKEMHPRPKSCLHTTLCAKVDFQIHLGEFSGEPSKTPLDVGWRNH